MIVRGIWRISILGNCQGPSCLFLAEESKSNQIGLSLGLFKCCFGSAVVIVIVVLSFVILLSHFCTSMTLRVTHVLDAWHPPSPGLPGINGKLFRWGSHPSGDVFKKKSPTEVRRLKVRSKQVMPWEGTAARRPRCLTEV